MTRLPGVPDETIIDVIPPGELAEIGILQAVPVLQMTWYDERAGCVPGHKYAGGELAGAPADYEGCYFYRAGGCKMNGKPERDGCLFHLPESAREWGRLRANALLELPEGGYAVTTRASAAEIAADMGARIVGAVPVTETR